MKAYLQYKDNGKFWKAGKYIWGLIGAWNHATNPSRPMTDGDHKRSFTYARAIKNRMKKLGFEYGKDYFEMSDGSLWPIKRA